MRQLDDEIQLLVQKKIKGAWVKARKQFAEMFEGFMDWDYNHDNINTQDEKVVQVLSFIGKQFFHGNEIPPCVQARYARIVSKEIIEAVQAKVKPKAKTK